jgi:tRNA threonylcarbamoyladenosine biosynthesis protein TsaB
LAELSLLSQARHSQTLLATIRDLFSLTGYKIEAVKLVVCTVGPGSFTGLRIGIATAKGLSLALKVPVAGVSTLASLAFGQPGGTALVCPLLDAGNERVYGALYGNDTDPARKEVLPAQVMPIQDFLACVSAPALFVGNAARRHKSLIEKTLGDRAFFSVRTGEYISAGAVGLLGLYEWQNGRQDASLTPLYLRTTGEKGLI